MGQPVVVVASGGLPITISTNGYGLPVTIATNGYGIPVTIVASKGLPVVGNIGGSDVGPAYSMLALSANFRLTGEDMTPITEFVMTADNTGVTNKFVLAGQSADLIAPAPTYQPETTAWVNAVVATGLPGNTVSDTQRARVDALIVAYKAAGVWALIDHEWLFAAETRVQAMIDIKTTAQWTTPGAIIVFTAGRGIKEGGFGGYLDLGYAPSGGTNFQQNSASMGAYVLTNRTTPSVGAVMGSQNVNDYSFFRPLNSGNIEHCINDGWFNAPANPGGSAWGNYLFSRTSSSLLTPYKNNAALSTGAATTTVARSPFNWFVLNHNSNGVPGVGTNDEVASVFTGGGMTGTQALAKNAALNAYMTATGCNVY